MADVHTDGFFERAVGNYARTVAKTAYAYTKNTADAEDISQEVFLTLYSRSESFESEEHLKAWLLRVTINKCKDHLKSAWMSRRSELSDTLQSASEEKHPLLDALLTLPEKYKIPLHLHYYEGYSIAEIAEIIDTKPATVGTRLARGREKLKEVLGGDYNA